MRYIPATGWPEARVMLVGEAPDGESESRGVPFSGATGSLLDELLPQAGMSRAELFLTNVVRHRPLGNKIEAFVDKRRGIAQAAGLAPYMGRWVAPFVPEHISDLREEILRVKPNVIVALGDVALWALCGGSGIDSWRGFVVPCTLAPDYKVVPTFHPKDLFKQWANRFELVHDLKRARKESAFAGLATPKGISHIRPSLQQFVDYTKNIKKGDRVTVDIETRRGHTACIGLCHKGEAMCIPLMESGRGDYWPFQDELLIIQTLRWLFLNCFIIMQNGSYDSQYNAKHWLVRKSADWDTAISHHVCFPGLLKRLDYLATIYCEQPRRWKEDGKEWRNKMDEEILWRYNCLDGLYTEEIAAAQEGLVEKLGLKEQVAFQCKLASPYLGMMLRGVRRDEEKRKAMLAEMDPIIADRLRYLEAVLGHPLNPQSPKQVQALFYTDFGIKPVYARKKKGEESSRITTDDEALDVIMKREPLMIPVCKALKENRSARVFKSTFLMAPSDEDHRLRCSYNMTGAETFRRSSSASVWGTGHNFQNIPKGRTVKAAKLLRAGPMPVKQLVEELGAKGQDAVDDAVEAGYITVSPEGMAYFRFSLPNVRSSFIPDPGYTAVDIDLARADVWVVAWESGDISLKQLLLTGADLHKENAAVLGCERQVAKVWVHAANYGAKDRTLAEHCHISESTSNKMRHRWFGEHPGILQWHKATEQELRDTGGVRNAFGYFRRYFDRLESILAEALAWKPQSTVAIATDMGLLNIHETMCPSLVQLLLQTHDSIGLQVLTDRKEELKPCILANMAVTVPYPDPLIIPVEWKESEISFGDCE